MSIISDICLRHNKIERYMEMGKTGYLDRSYSCINSFWGSFFEFSLENSCADIYDLLEIRHSSLRKYAKNINEITAYKYYKMMAFMHLTEFAIERDKNLARMGYMYFRDVFLPDRIEKRFFELMLRCFFEFENEFKDIRSAVYLKYVFSAVNEQQNVLAFISTFCYNSYNEFIRSFNRFMTVERRIELAK